MDEEQARHHRHLYEGEPEEDLIAGLEPDQLVDAMERPLSPAQLSRIAVAGLWALRIFVLAVTALVAIAFVATIVRGP